jgi:NTP pyrophosphatase (non-canonical NTP hydrolase)
MENLKTPLSFKQIQQIALANEVKAGWDTSSSTPEQAYKDMILLTHAELSEGVEDLRNHKNLNEVWYEEKDGHQKPCGIPTELADVVIRIMGFCERYDIQLQSVIEEKLTYNAKRGFRHGGKKF